jgi:hypothetical protein
MRQWGNAAARRSQVKICNGNFAATESKGSDRWPPPMAGQNGISGGPFPVSYDGG